MKRRIALILAFVILLTVAGCSKQTAPAGEAPLASSAVVSEQEFLEGTSTEISPQSQKLDEEAPAPSEPEPSSQASAGGTAAVLPVSLQPDPLPAASSGEGGDMASSASAPSSASTSSELVIPRVSFSAPVKAKYYSHYESSLEELIAWLNSSEALEEEGGAFREVVLYYRERSSMLRPVLRDPRVFPVNSYGLLSNGLLMYSTSSSTGDIKIMPVADSETSAAAKGIAAYLTEAKGKPAAKESLTAEKMSAATQLALCKIPAAGASIQAVNEVQPIDLPGGEFIYLHVVHWLYRDFYIFYDSNTLDANEAAALNTDLFANLSFEEIPLRSMSGSVGKLQ